MRLETVNLRLGRNLYSVVTFIAIALLISLLPAGGAAGQSGELPELVDPEPIIQADPQTPTDQQIEARIVAIFAQVETLGGIQVSVAEGVVALSGSVAKDEHASMARELAIRLSGVVTVVDNVERSLGVEENIAPLLDGIYADIKRWIKAIPLFLMALLLLFVISYAGHLLASQVGLWRRISPNTFLAELLAQAVRVFAIGLGVITALNLLGAGTLIGTLLGGAGILTLAIGFAIRDTLENYISSIMLSLRQPFRADDHVVINDLEGIVVRLTSRATVLMTPEGNQLRIPNSTVFKGVILNYSRNPERRFDFELGVDAADDPVAAMQVGLMAMETLDFVLAVPKASAYIKTIGDSNIVLCFMGWVNQRDVDFRKTRSLAISLVMRAVEDQGFTLPEPIYRIRMDGGSKVLAAVQKSLDGEGVSEAKREDRVATPINPQAADAAEDVRPNNDITKLVSDERESQQETDLLDSSSPRE